MDFGVLPNHPPPTSKGRMFTMRQPGPSPPGGKVEKGYRGGARGETEMKFMVPMPFLSFVLGGSTDSSVAEPNLRCFLVTTMAEKPW